MTAKTQTETHEFQAEVRQVLNLMINSLYSNKEIFLRELISNASDACDKLRFEAIADDSLLSDDTELKITVLLDEEARELRVIDNGVGMSREDVIENIGTIARSGTRRFLESLSGDQRTDSQLIGQFGVGFYSAFIVADKVTVLTRRAGEDPATGVRWESDGAGEYTLETVEREARGTEVILHLREEEDEFLKDYRVRGVISNYSDHVAFPIYMEKPAPPASDDDDAEQPEDAAPEMEKVNQASALWTRPKNDIDDDEYQSFYKHVSHDFNDALTWTHNKVEGSQSYTTLIYLPEKAPFDLMTARDERRGLKLYVRRVFIMDAAEQLLPAYLRFVRGVVDSDDLPLNVSRELLQDNPLVRKIRSALVKRSLDLIESLAKNEPDKFAEFWQQFGEVIKEGPVEDFTNRDRLLRILRFASTHEGSAEQTVSLDDYVSRMKGDQDKIYYLTADSHTAAKNSPHLEAFRKHGIEVLLLSDRVDEWMMGHVHEFDGKPLQSVAKGEIDLGNLDDDDAKDKREAAEKSAEPVVKRLQELLSDDVDEVRVSHRLTESPAVLVLNEHDMAVHMQKLLKQAGHDMPGSKPHLEINVDHALVQRLAETEDDDAFEDLGRLLFEQALLNEGGSLDDPSGFVRRLNRLLLSMSG